MGVQGSAGEQLQNSYIGETCAHDDKLPTEPTANNQAVGGTCVVESLSLEEQILIGNTLEETAYHEAGHVVIAGAVGLDLKPLGIVIWEVAEDVTDGIASYWEDTAEWEKVLLALCAGQMAQLKQFPCSWTRGSQPDVQVFSKIVNTHFEQDRFREMHDNTNSRVASLLEIHWSAVTSIALALMEGPWIIVEPTEHPKAKRKKHLDGSTLVPILRRHGITAHVRNSQN